MHFACGAGTYLFLDSDNKVIPITRFVDVEGLVEHLQNAVERDAGQERAASASSWRSRHSTARSSS